MGADRVAFVGNKFKPKKNYPEEVARYRLENLLKPICELAEMPIVPEEPGEKFYCNHFLKAAHMAWREYSRVWKYPYQKKYDHITVTIRESFRYKNRDSNRPEWEKFISWAENNGQKVVVIEDAEKNGITIKDRWDAYQCKLNLFTGGGASGLCWMSDAPYVTFFKGLTAHDYYLLTVHHWMYTNSQFPWAKQNQRILWNKEDRFEDIVRCYEKNERLEVATSGAH